METVSSDRFDNIPSELIEENYDFLKKSYWRPHFAKHTDLQLNYYEVSDGVKLLAIHSIPKNYEGNTRPIIVYPGWFSFITGWTGVVKTISEKTEVIYFESREKISSIFPDNKVQMSVEQMTGDFAEICPKLPINISESIIVCSSMGSTVLMEYLAKYDNPPKETIMIGANAEFDYPTIPTKIVLALPVFMLSLARKFVKWYIVKFRLDEEKEPEQTAKYKDALDNADLWKVRQSARAVLDYTSWEILDQIKQEIILIGASHDKLHSTDQIINIAEKIKNSKYIDFKTNRATHSNKMGEFALKIAQDDYPQEILDIN